MKKINKNSYIFIDFDGVILDTEVRLEYMKGDRTWEEFSPTVDWTKLIKEAEEIESSIENLKEIEKTYKNVFILSKVHTIHEMKEKNFIYYELNTSVLEDIMVWLADLKGDHFDEDKNQ